MKTYKKVAREVEELESIECDRCNTVYDDPMEIQEFHFVNFIGGYASIFGDSLEVECDLCQYCLHYLIAENCRFS